MLFDELDEMTRRSAEGIRKLAGDLGVVVRPRGLLKFAAPMAGAEVKAPGALRSSASSAWHVGSSPPKPKTIPPNANLGASASGRATAKPPSKTSFYKDLVGSINNPQRGSRLAVPTPG